MATALTFGTIVSPLADTEFTFTTAGPFRLDVAGASYHIVETLSAGFEKTHSEQSLSGIDFSGLFPAGTDLKVVVDPTVPLPDGVTPYILVRELG